MRENLREYVALPQTDYGVLGTDKLRRPSLAIFLLKTELERFSTYGITLTRCHRCFAGVDDTLLNLMRPCYFL